MNISEAYQSTCPNYGLDFVHPDNVRLEVCQVCDAEMTKKYMSEHDTIYLYVTFNDYRNPRYIGNWLGSLKFYQIKVLKNTIFHRTVWYGAGKRHSTLLRQHNITLQFIDGDNNVWRGTLYNVDWNMSAKFRRI